MRLKHWLYTAPLRLRSLFRRNQVEEELDEELRYHIERQIEENIAKGMAPEEARYAALRAIGGVERRKDECRDMRRLRLIEDLAQDARYGLRTLRKSPGFTAAAVASLALGIGATTAVFSVVDALMLRRLPVRSPEQLVMLSRVFPNGKNPSFLYAYFEGFRGLTDIFSGAYAVCRQDRYNVTLNGSGGAPSIVDGGLARVSLVTGSYFSELGINAGVGRTFTEADDRVSGGHPVTVISYGYWERKFGRVSDIVGRTLTLNGATYTIIGVAPRDFSGEWIGRPADFWIPLAMLYQVMPELPPGQRGGGDGLRIGMNFRIIARLKPGVTMKQAQAIGQVTFQRLMTEAAGSRPTPQQLQQIAQSRLEVESASTGYSQQRESFARPLAILMFIVGAALLVACANIAILLLARATARRREIAVRLSLGARRARIMRQLLTESALLAMMGGALGFLLAWWGADVLMMLVTSSSEVNASLSLDLDVRPDIRVLAFTTALCLGAGVLFGLAPAFRGSNVSLATALCDRGAGSGGSEDRLGLRKLLVITQIALSLLLLVGAGLFTRTLRNLKLEDLGFDREHVLLVWTNPGQTGRQTHEIASLWGTVQERISSSPGVVSASPSVNGLLTGSSGGSLAVRIEGYTPKPQEDLVAQREIVGPNFFATVGQRLLLGRDFTAQDTADSPRVTIINESMARHFFGGANPIGKRFTDSENRTSEIVGVVTDARYNSPRDQNRRMFFYPYRQQIILHRLIRMCVAIKAAGDPVSIAASVRQELRNIDPNLPVLRIATVGDQFNDLLVQERLIATLSGFFGALAVLLSCLGLYGVMSYSVARRTNEIGIRLALGATRANILAMALKESLWLVSAGIAIGALATLATTRLISTLLYEVDAADPFTVTGAALLLFGVAALAAFLPARRAARIDPMESLRHE